MEKFEQPENREYPPEINWVRPTIQEEAGEIERTAETISGSTERYPSILAEITEAIGNADIEDLTDEVWAALENTESYHDVRPGHIEDVQKIAEGYERDWRLSLHAMQKGAAMQAPIILIKRDGIPYLVSGNTRLMIARAMEVKVKAVMARLKKVEGE